MSSEIEYIGKSAEMVPTLEELEQAEITEHEEIEVQN